MSPLNSSNADSQGIKFELNDSNKTAEIIGYANLSTSNIIIKRGVENTNGSIYKVTSMTPNCLTNATSITSITFDKTKLDEFQYELSGFPSNLALVIFKDQTLPILPFIETSFRATDPFGLGTDGNGNWVCGSNTSRSIHYSKDNGLTWNTVSNAGIYSARDVTYGNGTFIIVGDYENVHSSTDMITWIDRGSLKRWNACAYGNNTWVSGTHGDGGIYFSSDLTSWTQSNMRSDSCRQIIFNGSIFAAVVSDRLYTSTNGSEWTLIKTFGVPSESLSYGNNHYVVCTNTGILVSDNSLSTWNTYLENYKWVTCACGNNKCIAINNNGEIYETSDFTDWSHKYTVDAHDFIWTEYGKGRFIIVTYTGKFYVLEDQPVTVDVNVDISDGIYISNTYYKIANGDQIPRTGNELFVLTGTTQQYDKLVVKNDDGTDINVQIKLNNCNFDNQVDWASTVKHENRLDTGYITVKYYIEGTNIMSSQMSDEFVPGRNTTTTFTSIGGGTLTLTNNFSSIGVFEEGFLDSTSDNATLLIDDKANVISATLKGIEYTDYSQMFRDGWIPGNKPLILTFGPSTRV